MNGRKAGIYEKFMWKRGRDDLRRERKREVVGRDLRLKVEIMEA